MVLEESVRSRPVGRPRDAQTQAAIRDAALKLVAQLGYAKVTIDGIAAEAGVGKQTLYRWWPGKADIVLEAFTSDALSSVTVQPTGDARADLKKFLAQVMRRFAGPSGAVFKSLLAEALLNPPFAEKFRSAYLAQRIDRLEAILRSRPGYAHANVTPVVEMIYGSLWYRMATGQSITRELAVRLTDDAWHFMKTAAE